MTLTEKQVSGLTLSMLGRASNMAVAKDCALEGLYALAQRDIEWVKYLKEAHGIDFDYNRKLKPLYAEAENAIKKY